MKKEMMTVVIRTSILVSILLYCFYFSASNASYFVLQYFKPFLLLSLLSTTKEVVTNAAKFVAVSFIVSFYIFCHTSYLKWKKDFAQTRVKRTCTASPSHRYPPDVVPYGDQKEKVLEAANTHSNTFGQCELVRQLQATANPEQKRNQRHVVRTRAACTGSFQEISTRSSSSLLGCEQSTMPLPSPKELPTIPEATLEALDTESVTSENDIEKDKELDMDHIYLPFLSFLRGRVLISLFSVTWGTLRLIALKIRDTLHKRGFIKPKAFDPAEVVGRLCLEGTIAMYYKTTSSDGKTAGFFFTDFPVIEPNNTVRVYDLFVVNVDLETKKMTQARLDGEYLTPSQAMTLCAFFTHYVHHVKVHSFSNWGVNVEDEQWKNDSFVASNGVTTVVYNYMGYTMFPRLLPIWTRLGLIKDDYSDALRTCIDSGIKSGIPSHPQVRDLMKHSELVNFLVKARSIFMSEFQKHSSHFPGIHGEALFIGTAMHGLDHDTIGWCVEDPLWLDVDDPKFGPMASIARIARAGFVEDLPFVPVHHKFNGSGHPFFEAVYAKCAKLNKQFADSMDTCIIK